MDIKDYSVNFNQWISPVSFELNNIDGYDIKKFYLIQNDEKEDEDHNVYYVEMTRLLDKFIFEGTCRFSYREPMNGVYMMYNITNII